MTLRFFGLALIAAVTLLGAGGQPALSGPNVEQAPAAEGDILRVGGDYTVAAIDPLEGGLFAMEFRAVQPTGRFDTLRLESDHVHVAVKVGQTIRLSAEVLSQKGPTAEVAQVVVFLPGREGHVPVWLLSTKAAGRDLRASRYLEMHVPANDYIVM